MRGWRNGVAMVVLAFLMPVGAVRGDMGLPFLVDEDYPIMRFDNLADYPDFDFYLKYGHGRGNPSASLYLTPVRSGEPVREFQGRGRKTQVFLLAVPRGQQPPAVKADHNWLTETPPGCLQSAPLEGTSTRAGFLVPYRVQIEDGKLNVTMLPAEWQAGAWTLNWLPWFLCLLVPIVFCAALAWLGVRIARRLSRPKPRVAGTNP